jgi:rhizosphere induced protein
MTQTYSLRLENASEQAWTFFIYQLPRTIDGRIDSLVWISSPCVVAVHAHTTLMWDEQTNFVWQTSSLHAAGGKSFAKGHFPVDSRASHGVLFNQNDNAPAFTACSDELAPGPLTVTVAANVPNNVYSIGTAIDGAQSLATKALVAQRYNFAGNYWIGAAPSAQAASLLDPAQLGPSIALRFPPNVFALSFTLNQQEMWMPTTHNDIVQGAKAAHRARIATTETQKNQHSHAVS